MTFERHPCKFPFNYRGTIHNECLWGIGANKSEDAWCPVTLDEDSNAQEWSRCSSHCPLASKYSRSRSWRIQLQSNIHMIALQRGRQLYPACQIRIRLANFHSSTNGMSTANAYMIRIKINGAPDKQTKQNTESASGADVVLIVQHQVSHHEHSL